MYGASGSPPNLFDNIENQKDVQKTCYERTLKIPRNTTLHYRIISFFIIITLMLVMNY